MKLKLNARNVSSIPAPERGQREVFDSEQRGLVLRVSTTGRSWNYVFRWHHRARRMTLGRWPDLSLADARAKARIAAGKVANGIDPGEEKLAERRGETIGELVELYLERRVHGRMKNAYEEERMVRKDILSRWEHRRVRDVTRRDCRELVEAVQSRASVAGNRVAGVLSRLLGFAVDREWIDVSPCVRITRVAEKPRDRVLDDNEIRQVWHGVETESARERSIVRLGLLLGARLSEIVELEFSELDLVSGLWVLPGERAKNGNELRTPLVGEAFRILREMREAAPESQRRYVFPGRLRRDQPLSTIEETMARLRAGGLVNVKFHDLRRTFVSRLAELEIDEKLISRIVNHAAVGITSRVYDRHSYLSQKRAALERWDARLRQIVAGERVTAKVVPIHG